MRRLILAALACVLMAGPAVAGYEAGMRAYWRGDYSGALNEFRPLANGGDADAQFMLGQLYAGGEGVPQDFVEAHLWYNLSASGGNTRAAQARDELAGRMTPTQVAQAQRRARYWRPAQAASPAVPAPAATAQPPAAELLQRERVAEIQRHLATLHYDPGVADGWMGFKTREAIRKYQHDAGLAVDGEASASLLDHLRAAAGTPAAAATADGDAGDDVDEAEAQKQLAALVAGLKTAIADGRSQHLADLAFLARLEQLVAPSGTPGRRPLISDNFRDGEYFRQPTWSVVSGRFAVDNESHLVSTVSPARSGERDKARAGDVAISILGQMLGAPGQNSGPAEIYLPQPIPGDFEVSATLRLGPDSACEFAVVSSADRENRYRLLLTSGQQPALIRQSAAGAVTLASGKQALAAGSHDYAILWRRLENGRLIVRLDGEQIIKFRDRNIADPFSGLAHVNRLGQCAVREVLITARE